MITGTRYLHYKRGTSRGYTTYGYTLISLTDSETGKKYRTNGGGYDMLGTVLAGWMSETLQTELKTYLTGLGMTNDDGVYSGKEADAKGWPYGSYINKSGKAGFDGACGVNLVESLIQTLGCDIKPLYEPKGRDPKGKFLGYLISPKEA